MFHGLFLAAHCFRLPTANPPGCQHLLRRLREVKPCLHAFGHVHANQGQRWLRWRLIAAARRWRAERKAAWDSGERDGGYLAPPEDPKRGPLLGPRRVVRGFDASKRSVAEGGENDLRDTGVGAEADDGEGRRALLLPS